MLLKEVFDREQQQSSSTMMTSPTFAGPQACPLTSQDAHPMLTQGPLLIPRQGEQKMKWKGYCTWKEIQALLDKVDVPYVYLPVHDGVHH